MDYNARIEEVKEKLGEQGKDALLATGGANTYYFSGFHTVSEGDYPLVLIPQEGDAQLVVSGLDKDAAAYAATIELLVPDESFADAIIAALPDDAEVVIEKDMSIGLYQKLDDGLELSVDDGIVSELRSKKSQAELEQLRDAYRIAENALDDIQPAIENTERLSESRIAAELEYNMRRNGSQAAAFPTIVATGASASLPHHTTSDADINEGPLLFDFGATVNGYRSDISRTFHIGEPTEQFQEIYALVQKAQREAENMLQPGVKASEIDAAARNVFEENGYGDAFKHSTGHGVGLDVHEGPNLSPNNDDLLEEGMVVTIEPGIYLKGELGVRIEDAYHVTADGAERLAESSRELTVIKR